MSDFLSKKKVSQSVLIISTIIFLVLIFRFGIIPGFNEIQSDFPNYLTASKMLADGKDLSRIYENREFKQNAVYYGIPNQIVSFVPHSPPTMLIYLPIAKFEPLTAKRIWLSLSIVFLVLSMLTLSRTFKVESHICVLLSMSLVLPVANNFLLGQAYIFILFLSVLGLYLWKVKLDFVSGLLIGFGASIKPFGIFLVIPAFLQRRWLILSGIILGFLAPMIIIFQLNPEIISPYVKWVLPATISGEIQNPYEWSFRSYTVILRNLFLMDAERNPEPLFHSPFIFNVLRILITLLILHFFSVIQFLSKSMNKIDQVDAASTFLLASLLIAPVTSSYQFVLLLPVILVISRVFNKYQMMIVLNMHVFFIFSIIVKIPFIEFIYMVFLTIMIFFAIRKVQPETPFRKAVVWITPIVILSAIGGVIFSGKYIINDGAEYVSEIRTSGFPHELSVSGENVIFTEIFNGNYSVNLNNRVFSIEDIDLSTPSVSISRNPDQFSCYIFNNKTHDFGLSVIQFDDNNYWIDEFEPYLNFYQPFRIKKSDHESNVLYLVEDESEPGNLDIFLIYEPDYVRIRLTRHGARDYSPDFYNDQANGREYVYFVSERGGGLNDGRFYRIEITDIINEYLQR